MAEPPGSQLGLGIEAVEWLPTGESSATVTVTGRWRRRPSWQGRPVLVIEAEGRRHRFPAIPDPPSVAGAAPGTWRMSFSIPAWLAPWPGGRAWLQLGVVLVPLPPFLERQDAGLVSEDFAEASPTEAESTEPPAAEPDAADSPVEASSGDEPQTADMLAAAAELTSRIKQLDAERRAAAARAEAGEGRRAELERQLVETRRRAEQSERLARETELQRERLRNAPESMRRASWREQLPAELELARRAPPARDGAHRWRLGGDLARLAAEQLRREQEAARAGELDHWRARSAELERRLDESALRAEQLYQVIEDLRSVLDVIRGVPSDQGAPGSAGAPGDVPDAATVDDDPAAPDAGPAVEPERLDTALSKLRETIPPADVEDGSEESEDASEELASGEGPPEPETEQRRPEPLPAPASPTRKSWLLRTLRALAKDDPAVAGRVALGLLPAQRLASVDPLTYDVLLSDAGSFHVTAGETGARVVRARQPRDPAESDFQLRGELATFARLLVAGPIRRRLERGVAELGGSRKALASLLALIRTPYGLAELYAAGARLEPWLAFALIARMIDQRWTVGHRFTIAHRGPDTSTYLRVPGGSRPWVSTSPPLGPVAATVVCDPDELLAALATEGFDEATIRGRSEELELLRAWVARAQSS